MKNLTIGPEKGGEWVCNDLEGSAGRGETPCRALTDYLFKTGVLVGIGVDPIFVELNVD